VFQYVSTFSQVRITIDVESSVNLSKGECERSEFWVLCGSGEIRDFQFLVFVLAGKKSENVFPHVSEHKEQKIEIFGNFRLRLSHRCEVFRE
jgi:hypothetical protein